jgi:hypothetical protein
MGCGNVMVVSGSDHDPDHRLERPKGGGFAVAILAAFAASWLSP